jgi:hypothetical protein
MRKTISAFSALPVISLPQVPLTKLGLKPLA